MKNYVQDEDLIPVTAPYALTSGGGALVGSIFGIATKDAANGTQAILKTQGVVDLVAEGAGSGQAIAQGAAVYWDNTNKRATATSSGNTKIGVAIEAKLTAATSVRVRLNGTF